MLDSVIAKVEADGIPSKSKLTKMIKYKHSPGALLVYTDKKEHAKEARRQMYDKYGTIQDENNWPTMSDDSKMLFAPLLHGNLSEDFLLI